MEIKDFINNSIESSISNLKESEATRLSIVSDGTGKKLTSCEIVDGFRTIYLTLTPDELNDFIRLLTKHKNFIDGNLNKVSFWNTEDFRDNFGVVTERF